MALPIRTLVVTGPPIEPQTQEIFQPFAKAKVVGIGLGPRGINVQYDNGLTMTFIPVVEAPHG